MSLVQTLTVAVLFCWLLFHLEWFWTCAASRGIRSRPLTDAVSFMTAVLAKYLQTKLPGVFVAPRGRLMMLLLELCSKSKYGLNICGIFLQSGCEFVQDSVLSPGVIDSGCVGRDRGVRPTHCQHFSNTFCIFWQDAILARGLIIQIHTAYNVYWTTWGWGKLSVLSSQENNRDRSVLIPHTFSHHHYRWYWLRCGRRSGFLHGNRMWRENIIAIANI